MSPTEMRDTIESYYGAGLDQEPDFCEYHERHGTRSACILTVTNDEKAAQIAEYLRERIEGKIVVEVGAGIGLLACHLAHVAKRVYAIELDPAWSSVFVAFLYRHKPANLTFVFGRAEDAPHVAADVAVFCTHSAQAELTRAASRFAPVVIDVYEEIVPGAVARVTAEVEAEIAAQEAS